MLCISGFVICYYFEMLILTEKCVRSVLYYWWPREDAMCICDLSACRCVCGYIARINAYTDTVLWRSPAQVLLKPYSAVLFPLPLPTHPLFHYTTSPVQISTSSLPSSQHLIPAPLPHCHVLFIYGPAVVHFFLRKCEKSLLWHIWGNSRALFFQLQGTSPCCSVCTV